MNIGGSAMSDKDGGSAFPIIPPIDQGGTGSAGGYPFPECGMSLRDYFAGNAMARMMTTYRPTHITMGENIIKGLAIDAALAYAAADAMLAERSKQ